MLIKALMGDITEQRVDAIVNSANPSLLAGGGVCGAIHAAAGQGLEIEARGAHERCEVGNAVLTAAYALPARHVIHAVGPRYIDGGRGEAELLGLCYRNILLIAENAGITSLAIPAISVGIYNFPYEQATEIAIKSIKGHVAGSLREVRFILLHKDLHDLYSHHLSLLMRP
jgi:O-acetyl-ADP-ribose deacetylase (regulator of RNase III)